jgi:hypothetical protein
MTVVERWRRRTREAEMWGPYPPGPPSDAGDIYPAVDMRALRVLAVALRVCGWLGLVAVGAWWW